VGVFLFWLVDKWYQSDTIMRMPRKIRQLIADLKSAGFINRGWKSSHRNFEHALGGRVTISGRPGDDAKHYQEAVVKAAIQQSKKSQS
jgi:predicted RNA binding protein YcfA (HicA-like mRNA interferase family)